MPELVLNNVKIDLPKEVDKPTQKQMLEWLEYNLGISGIISTTNPLCDVDFHDCKIQFKESKINGVDVVF